MLIKERYEIIKKIGEGGFAKVFLAQDTKLDMLVALKRYEPLKFEAELKKMSPQYSKINIDKYSVLTEIKRGIKLNHPNIIRYFDAFEYSENTSFGSEKYEVGVMNYLPDGNWSDFVERHGTSGSHFRKSIEGVLRGLEYLHSKGIIHRDITPSNILFDGFTPKITDFGISKELKTSSKNSTVLLGKISYMAPEQISPSDFGINNSLSYNCDLWALAVIIYQFFVGHLPFSPSDSDFDIEITRKNILSPNYNIPDMDKVPPSFRIIVDKCLVRNANNRIKSVDEIFNILEQYDNNSVKKDDGTEPIKKEGKNKKDEKTDVIDPNEGKVKIKKDLPFIKYFIVGLSALVLALGGWYFYQSNKKIDSDGKNMVNKKSTNAIVNDIVNTKDSGSVKVVTPIPPSKHSDTNKPKTSEKIDITKEKRLLNKYFETIFDENLSVNQKNNNFDKYENEINKLFTKDARIKLKGSGLYNVSDFFTNFIINGGTIHHFEIKGHKNGKISYLKIN